MFHETFKEILTAIFKGNNNTPLTEDEIFENPLLRSELQKEHDEDISDLRDYLERLVTEHYIKHNPPTIQKPDTYQMVRMVFTL